MGKEIDNHRNRHVEHAGSQDIMTVGWIDNSSNENIESNGGMENGAGECVGKAHHTASIPSTIIAAAASVGDCGQPPLIF